MKKKRTFSIEFKCKCIAFYMDEKIRDERTSLCSISKRLKIDRRTFTRWFKIKNDLFACMNKRK